MTDKRYPISRETSINRAPPVEAIETIMRNNGLNLKVNDINVYKTALNQYRPYLSLNDAFKNKYGLY